MPAGRPKFPPDQVKTERIEIRCTRGELGVMKAKAEAEGMTLSAWMRKRLVGDDASHEESCDSPR